MSLDSCFQIFHNNERNLTISCPHCAISQNHALTAQSHKIMPSLRVQHALLVMIEKMKSARDNKEFRTARDNKEFRTAILRDLSKVLTYLSRSPHC